MHRKKATWISVLKLNSDIISLSDIFEVDVDVWEKMMILMGLGTAAKSGKFWFKKQFWDDFFVQVQFEKSNRTYET